MQIINTERLLLRHFTMEDAPLLFELNNDPEVIKYTGDDPFKNLNAANEFIQNYIASYQSLPYARWAVVLKSNNELLGWCGLKYQTQTQDTDIGYRFFKHHWGKGYATEAARSCLQLGFMQFGLNEIIGNVMHENKASIHVLKKIGMLYWRESSCADHPSVQYKITRDQFLIAMNSPL